MSGSLRELTRAVFVAGVALWILALGLAVRWAGEALPRSRRVLLAVCLGVDLVGAAAAGFVLWVVIRRFLEGVQ